MVIPNKLKIGGHEYSVTETDNLLRDSQAAGHSCGNGLYIGIDSSMPQSNKESTLLHEIIEQINYLNNLNLPHQVISTLETSLYQVFTENGLLK